MKKTFLAMIGFACAATLGAPAFARDDGPRFAQDHLDRLVAQHADANRHIRGGTHGAAASGTVSSQSFGNDASK
ncbi:MULTISPECIES: hypothetical protein [unclassified Caballeronia]|uniref:hypothetical protein n=1 Tax=unclassified Caballeronia TaxID=2646786 RepID=UPI002028EC1E|nr:MULTISPECIES: hypothetical protein [unclassified Caballeronia]MDR5771558.1 hypothetical protein [Caballeronia sp. LZ002]MDR5805344.1 hypothetical protein [Caballeronia sp. LZ001]MDR5846994.1 hypothetical protein [Caballeronia sp. LZ003]